MADRIIRREADRQDIGDAALAELLGTNQRLGEGLQQIVAEGTLIHGLVLLTSAFLGDIVPGPRLAGIVLGMPLVIERLSPRRHLGVVVVAGNELTARLMEPERPVRHASSGKDRAAVLHGNAEHLRLRRAAALELVANRRDEQTVRG